MVSDGKSVGIHGRSVDGQAQFDAPGDLDTLFHAPRAERGHRARPQPRRIGAGP